MSGRDAPPPTVEQMVELRRLWAAHGLNAQPAPSTTAKADKAIAYLQRALTEPLPVKGLGRKTKSPRSSARPVTVKRLNPDTGEVVELGELPNSSFRQSRSRRRSKGKRKR